MQAVREIGSALSGEPAVIHHLYGETCQVKIELVSTNIGHDAIIGLTEQEHRNLHANNYAADRRVLEKTLFMRVTERLVDHPDRPSEAHIKAVMEYRK